MEKQTKKKDVLVVRDEKTGELGVVSGLGKDGTPNTVDPKGANRVDFLKFDRGGNPLDNFFMNFYRQCKEPTRFGFYRIAAEGAEQVIEALRELLKVPEANKDLLDPHKVDTQKYVEQAAKERQETQLTAPKPGEEQTKSENTKRDYKSIDESRINWESLEKNWGVKREVLEQSGDLDKMLKYGKSSLVSVSPKFGDEQFNMQARLSFKQGEDGNIRVVPHFIRLEPNLKDDFMGHKFSSEDIANLKATGNMGRAVPLIDPKSGFKTPSLISIDRQTNEVVSMPISKIRIPHKIGTTPLSEQEQIDLKAGRAIPNKEIVLSNGKKFTATLQVNADQRGVEFLPRSTRLQQSATQAERQTNREGRTQKGYQWLDEQGNIRAPKTFGGVKITPEQQRDFSEGKAIYVEGMVVDGKGEPFTAYIKFNREEGRQRYYRNNPDISQATQVKPSAKSETQVAVNSEGKTNEATKNIREPLRQGQINPTNETQQRQQKRPKGITM